MRKDTAKLLKEYKLASSVDMNISLNILIEMPLWDPFVVEDDERDLLSFDEDLLRNYNKAKSIQCKCWKIAHNSNYELLQQLCRIECM
jgi:hypothetical protein|tara:strand:+ start:365 stop:628 length:264 start_codon:yes stop_codon:yes gene_type:complete